MSLRRKYSIMRLFPDFDKREFDMEAYNRQFVEANILIHAKSAQVSYPEHWGPLSVKCARQGQEYYTVNGCRYAVTDANYLVINNGNYYSSFIDANREVESFTINFTPGFVREVTDSLLDPDETLLGDFGNSREKGDVEFIERLYVHDDIISPLLSRMMSLTDDFTENIMHIEELYFSLLEKLVASQRGLLHEISSVPALRRSTRLEIYKKLYRAKDFIDSCFTREISLDDLANVCCLNGAYLLRQFKKYFKITPRQYIISKRLEAAKQMLDKSDSISVSEVCLQIGYNDLSSFSRLFKRFYQYSPENYQRIHHQKTASFHVPNKECKSRNQLF